MPRKAWRKLVAGEQLFARSLADDAASLDDVAAVGQVERLAHVLLDVQDRHALGIEPLDLLSLEKDAVIEARWEP